MASSLDRKKHMSTNITKKLEGKVALVTGGHHDEARTENRRPHAIRDFTHIYINGEWVKPLGGKVIDIINPATERPAGQITLGTAADVDRAVAAARRAFIAFSRRSRQERLDLLSRILEVYLKRQDDLADALTEELGAPKKFAKEQQVGAGLLHLQTAIAVLKDYQFEYSQSNRTIIRREPIGVIGMISNFRTSRHKHGIVHRFDRSRNRRSQTRRGQCETGPSGTGWKIAQHYSRRRRSNGGSDL
jgi:hypothetical protein